MEGKRATNNSLVCEKKKELYITSFMCSGKCNQFLLRYTVLCLYFSCEWQETLSVKMQMCLWWHYCYCYLIFFTGRNTHPWISSKCCDCENPNILQNLSFLSLSLPALSILQFLLSYTFLHECVCRANTLFFKPSELSLPPTKRWEPPALSQRRGSCGNMSAQNRTPSFKHLKQLLK